MRPSPLLLSFLSLASHSLSSPARLLHQFPHPEQWVESITQLEGGLLVAATLDDGRIYSIDPFETHPTARLAAHVPGFSRFTGIVRVAPNVVATTGGVVDSFLAPFNPGTVSVVLLDFSSHHHDDENGTVPYKIVASLPEASFSNGLASLPEHPHVILSADSANARIDRIDTQTGKHDVVFSSNSSLGMGPHPPVPLGINGIEVQGGYIYFTNSGKLTYGRLRIDSLGNPVTGHVETLLDVPSQYNPDGLTIARESGDAYIALHPESVGKVTPSGKLSIVDIDTSETGALQTPTDVILSRDERTMYVVTAGNATEAHMGGQIVQVDL